MIRRHRMPFGAEYEGGRGTRFRLWAPGAHEVVAELSNGDARRQVHLRAEQDGWFEAVVADASPGTRYAYRIDGRDGVPDPASRANPDDVHAPSMVVDSAAYAWRDDAWIGRPWSDAVIYELHVGAFTPAGTFSAAMERLDYLADLGVTLVELMPVADFPGQRNWGYDGVLPFAPDASYGTPDELKRLVDAMHARGLMAMLDVVYNHFGPEGNYLPQYAARFFNPAHQTPWGAAVNFDGEGSRHVRDFFIHNALYWLEEFHFDGLRFDAVHAMIDDSTPHFLQELPEAIRSRMPPERHVHLVYENDRNEARYLDRVDSKPRHATAQWNDDLHHVWHVVLTGERDGYYADYAERPQDGLGRTLAEGFMHQGDASAFRNAVRGEPSAHLPPAAFVDFLQNHDQIGNRAFGERLHMLAEKTPLETAVACLLLAPSPPLLFMGEEFAASSPFLFFCDFGPDLARAVAEGRREEFKRFARFSDPEVRARIHDPNETSTFEKSRLDWRELEHDPHRQWHAYYRRCLSVRQRHLAPRLSEMVQGGTYALLGESVLAVQWPLQDGAQWQLIVNLGTRPALLATLPSGQCVYASDRSDTGAASSAMPPWGIQALLYTP